MSLVTDNIVVFEKIQKKSNEFSTVAGQQANIQVSIVFLCITQIISKLCLNMLKKYV